LAYKIVTTDQVMISDTTCLVKQGPKARRDRVSGRT
ncbi:MAG: hypothetical protein QOJ43_866, partial [Gaiellaceae bacterium]|nr:hypothetical protein [Gaiellaceae bacterium]